MPHGLGQDRERRRPELCQGIPRSGGLDEYSPSRPSSGSSQNWSCHLRSPLNGRSRYFESVVKVLCEFVLYALISDRDCCPMSCTQKPPCPGLVPIVAGYINLISSRDIVLEARGCQVSFGRGVPV